MRNFSRQIFGGVVLAFALTTVFATTARAEAILTLDYTNDGRLDVFFDLNGEAPYMVGYSLDFDMNGATFIGVTFGDYLLNAAEAVVADCAVSGTCDPDPTVADLLLEFEWFDGGADSLNLFGALLAFMQGPPPPFPAVPSLRPGAIGAGLLFSLEYSGALPTLLHTSFISGEEYVGPDINEFGLIDIEYSTTRLTNSPTPVPEPGTLSLLTIGGALAYRMRRNRRDV